MPRISKAERALLDRFADMAGVAAPVLTISIPSAARAIVVPPAPRSKDADLARKNGPVSVQTVPMTELPHQALYDAELIVAHLGQSTGMQKHKNVLLCECPAHQQPTLNDDGEVMDKGDGTTAEHLEACGTTLLTRSGEWGDRFGDAVRTMNAYRMAAAENVARTPRPAYPDGTARRPQHPLPASTLQPAAPMRELAQSDARMLPRIPDKRALADPTLGGLQRAVARMLVLAGGARGPIVLPPPVAPPARDPLWDRIRAERLGTAAQVARASEWTDYRWDVADGLARGASPEASQLAHAAAQLVAANFVSVVD